MAEILTTQLAERNQRLFKIVEQTLFRELHSLPATFRQRVDRACIALIRRDAAGILEVCPPAEYHIRFGVFPQITCSFRRWSSGVLSLPQSSDCEWRGVYYMFV
jgi:hypothetical protein